MTSSTHGAVDRAAAALDAWCQACDPPVLVLHGPEGAGKRTAVERFFDAAVGSRVQKVAVRIGRTEGAAFEHDVLTRICESLWPDLAPFTEDTVQLRGKVLNEVVNRGGGEEDPPLLLALLGADDCEDWPPDAAASALSQLGSGARVVLTVKGSLGEARRWAERILGSASMAFHEVPRPAAAEIEGSGAPPWVVAGPAATDALIGQVLGRMRQSAPGAVEPALVLGALARALGPIGAAELAAILEVPTSAILEHLQSPGPGGAPVERLLAQRDGIEAIRFRHEALRCAALRLTAAQDRALESCFHGAAAAAVEAVHDRRPPPDPRAYLRLHAGDHLPAGEKTRVCAPRWLRPVSVRDLAMRRAEIRRVRRSIPREPPSFEGGEPGLWTEAVTRVALAQGALGSYHERWNRDADRPEGDVFEGANSALCKALLALATHASEAARPEVLALALTIAAEVEDARTLLAAAEAAPSGQAAGWARRAVVAARAASERDTTGEELDRELLFRAVCLLPAEEAQPLREEVISLACAAPLPGAALRALVGARALSAAEIQALHRAATSLPRGARGNALSALLPGLPEPEREKSIQSVLDALLDEPEEEPLDAAATVAAIAPFLDRVSVDRLLEDPPPGAGGVIAVRLAALGDAEAAARAVQELCGAGLWGARPLLLGAAHARSLASAAREALSALPAGQAAMLLREQPAAALSLLGLEGALAVAQRAGSSYSKVMALSSLCRAAPGERRPDIAASALRAHREDPDADALDAVLSCAPFLSPSDAAWLYSTSLGESGQGTLAGVAAGWAGVEHLAPLLPRIGGDPAVRAAAREIAAAAAPGGLVRP